MKQYRITLDKTQKIGRIERGLFGSFVEHLGRAVYNGIYEPGHPEADEKGFRRDVTRAVSELGVSVIRYPGGNFVSGYEWKRGIGPREERKEVIDLAWIAVEPNLVGVDEFAAFAEGAGAEVMMAVNLGTGSMQDVSDLVQYCNLRNQGIWAKKRIANGRAEPYGIRYWCLGNEMDGSWQVCSKAAEDYAKVAVDAAKIIKWISPGAKTIACGSCSPNSPTFPAWDETVLQKTFDYADYLSMHAYYTYPTPDKNLPDYFGCAKNFDEYITTGVRLIEAEKQRRGSDKAFYLSVDEWNIWHTDDGSNVRQRDWAWGLPLLENHYDFADAILFTELLITLMNHADYVKLGCLAQLVNVIAPILTEVGGGVLRQTTYEPFRYASAHFAGADALRTDAYLPTYRSQKWGEVKGVYHTAAYHEDTRVYDIALVNALDEAVTVTLGFDRAVTPAVDERMESDDPHAKNTFDDPTRVTLTAQPVGTAAGTEQTVTLGAHSIVFLSYRG